MTAAVPRLGVNIDHVATIRNARGGPHPDPIRAAQVAAEAGADGITLHVREDRRHVREEDLARLSSAVTLPINLEMACTDEMLAIALAAHPNAVCLVPERREERTTEGGLDVAGLHNTVAPYVIRLREAGIRVSLFIDPHPVQIAVAQAIGAPVVELHTGAYCDAAGRGDLIRAETELRLIREAAVEGTSRGIEVHAGHGITFDTVKPVAAIPEIIELNIGHFLVGEAIFIGLDASVRRMKALMAEARLGPRT
ncbi:MAG: pyridoxine 5'-phosphate synthase [Hyphomonadaceae bacterium]|nr:MAG: pyridoxine 5-phosphate synthase [Caulobacteraceae bacterium]MBT9445245.1 pyridoxine 5'-phosphate synthase [Hyphomonadaceae bacterium]TPW07285.1 MAG: pyridoxine 5-phosphate synthase [Alphaproteobacteria bacterium]